MLLVNLLKLQRDRNMRVLGIDPGLRSMGWGIVDSHGSKLRHVANGQCQTTVGNLADRLLSLFDGLSDVVSLADGIPLLSISP